MELDSGGQGEAPPVDAYLFPTLHSRQRHDLEGGAVDIGEAIGSCILAYEMLGNRGAPRLPPHTQVVGLAAKHHRYLALAGWHSNGSL